VTIQDGLLEGDGESEIRFKARRRVWMEGQGVNGSCIEGCILRASTGAAMGLRLRSMSLRGVRDNSDLG